MAVFNSEVFVCDTGNYRIQVFDLNGNFLRLWSVDEGKEEPLTMAFSPEGEVIVITATSVFMFCARFLIASALPASVSYHPNPVARSIRQTLAPK